MSLNIHDKSTSMSGDYGMNEHIQILGINTRSLFTAKYNL